MTKHTRGFTSRRHPEPALLPLRAALKGCYSGSNKTVSGSSRIFNKGFTLLEVLVVVIIIAVLAAIAVPQYKHAVLKSRFSALMPIGKAIAEGNEVYYMEHGAYASLPTQLDVSGQSDKYPDGTQVSMPQEEESLSYVLVTNDSVPNARYLVYQKHSPSFAGTTMCEAGDDKANELCIALGGVTLPSGGNSLGSADWTAYLLSGMVRSGDTFAAAGSGSGSGGGGAAIPARVLSGDPVCTNNSWNSTKCVYTYESGETLSEWKYPNETPTWACSSVTGVCYGLASSEAWGETSYSVFFDIDPETQVETSFDSEGNQFGVTVTKRPLSLTYDPKGNLIGGMSHPATNSYIYYDSEGKVSHTIVDGIGNYNPTGIPNLPQEELGSFESLSRSYLGKTKCQLYPELQECSTQQSGQ